MDTIARVIEAFNFQVPGSRWQLFEFCDLSLVPSFIKHCCQETLTAQWTKRLPLLQEQAPAELAALAIQEALETIEDLDKSSWTVIDFCSGAGGPTPYIEKRVNHLRSRRGLKPIAFRLSDLHPNLDAWMWHASHSRHLSFVPQSVDATNPPFSVISSSTLGDKESAYDQGYETNESKVFRLFCLSFHHFDDEAALKVMKSNLETCDAFAIIELQDRRIGSLALMLLEYWLLVLVTVFWFWHDDAHLIFTYLLPVLPAIQCFDGFVSCLRCRTFEEIIQLVERVQVREKGKHALKGNGIVARRGDWIFRSQRTLHTWPLGYMNTVIGHKIK